MKIDYKKFIEDNFMVLDRESQRPVPFELNIVQDKYYQLLQDKHPDMEGIREIVLKARQQGMSSFILAMFAVDFLLRPYSVSYCVSHRQDSTNLLFKKVKFYLQSYFAKLAERTGRDPEDVEKEFLITNNRNALENAKNKATFYILTAGAKVGGRGGSARNILFSECAFYQDTELVTAEEIVISTAQMVPQNHGMIFIESTANGEGNYYHKTWNKAERGESAYYPRFFSWQEFYTEEWVNQKKGEFANEKTWRQEYPKTPEEAFITSGTPYFDPEILNAMKKTAPEPIVKGKFSMSGELDSVFENEFVRLYREIEPGEQFVVFADPADSQDYCAAVAFSKKHYDCPLVFNTIMESSQFGYELFAMCKYLFEKTDMWPKLAIERNTGQATIYVLTQLNYSDMFRMVDFSSQGVPYEKGKVGWVTTGHVSAGELQGTRRKMLDDLSLAIRQGMLKIYDPTQIEQLKAFQIVKGRAQARSNAKDDLVMATAGAWQVHLVTPTVTWDDWDPEEFQKEKQKWRFK